MDYHPRTNAIWQTDVPIDHTAFLLYYESCKLEQELDSALARIKELEKLLAVEQKHLTPTQ